MVTPMSSDYTLPTLVADCSDEWLSELRETAEEVEPKGVSFNSSI
jgi:hypothetical protein